MKLFIQKVLLFISPFLLLIPLEVSVRNNTFQAKSTILSEKKDEIQLLLLGSSQNWRGVNPKYLDYQTAPLAFGGSALNIDYLLFDKYAALFPELKFVIIEMSYHSLEEFRDETWSKNHLIYHYFGINNYGHNPGLSQRFLLTSNPKAYLKKIILNTEEDAGKYNEFGFIDKPGHWRFGQLSFDSIKIEETSTAAYLDRHNKENINSFKKNILLLDKIIEKSLKRNIKVILLSPPKYYLYNDHMNENRLMRRNKVFEKYRDHKNIYVWNFERKYEYQPKYFLNEDHLNTEGAELFTKGLNKLLLEIDI